MIYSKVVVKSVLFSFLGENHGSILDDYIDPVLAYRVIIMINNG
jgi:hypothetical protein